MIAALFWQQTYEAGWRSRNRPKQSHSAREPYALLNLQ